MQTSAAIRHLLMGILTSWLITSAGVAHATPAPLMTPPLPASPVPSRGPSLPTPPPATPTVTPTSTPTRASTPTRTSTPTHTPTPAATTPPPVEPTIEITPAAKVTPTIPPGSSCSCPLKDQECIPAGGWQCSTAASRVNVVTSCKRVRLHLNQGFGCQPETKPFIADCQVTPVRGGCVGTVNDFTLATSCKLNKQTKECDLVTQTVRVSCDSATPSKGTVGYRMISDCSRCKNMADCTQFSCSAMEISPFPKNGKEPCGSSTPIEKKCSLGQPKAP